MMIYGDVLCYVESGDSAGTELSGTRRSTGPCWRMPPDGQPRYGVRFSYVVVGPSCGGITRCSRRIRTRAASWWSRIRAAASIPLLGSDEDGPLRGAIRSAVRFGARTGRAHPDLGAASRSITAACGGIPKPRCPRGRGAADRGRARPPPGRHPGRRPGTAPSGLRGGMPDTTSAGVPDRLDFIRCRHRVLALCSVSRRTRDTARTAT